MIQKQISGLSFMGYIKSLLGIRTVYILIFVVAVIMLIQTFGKEEPLRVGTRDPADHPSSSSAVAAEAHRPADKEDKED